MGVLVVEAGEKRGQLERIWNTASGYQNESLVDLPYLCFVPD